MYHGGRHFVQGQIRGLTRVHCGVVFSYSGTIYLVTRTDCRVGGGHYGPIVEGFCGYDNGRGQRTTGSRRYCFV